MDWCRLWHDMPNDPKWRTIARRSGRPVSEVLAVWTHMMVNASQASERGTLSGWDDEDIGTALDIDACHVEAIRDAMQGKTLEGHRLTGWDKRQPKREREDQSNQRVKAHRERQRNADDDHVTPCNATKRQETPRGEEIREEKKTTTPPTPSASPPQGAQPRDGPKRASRLPDDWTPTDADVAHARKEGMTDDRIFRTAEQFRDYWLAKAGANARKLDWAATWRTWVRREADGPGKGGVAPRQAGTYGDRRQSGGFAGAAARAAARSGVGEPVS